MDEKSGPCSFMDFDAAASCPAVVITKADRSSKKGLPRRSSQKGIIMSAFANACRPASACQPSLSIFDGVPSRSFRQKVKAGGERGIRTLDTPCGRIRAFQARSFSHSDISPIDIARKSWWDFRSTGTEKCGFRFLTDK